MWDRLIIQECCILEIEKYRDKVEITKSQAELASQEIKINSEKFFNCINKKRTEKAARTLCHDDGVEIKDNLGMTLKLNECFSFIFKGHYTDYIEYKDKAG